MQVIRCLTVAAALWIAPFSIASWSVAANAVEVKAPELSLQELKGLVTSKSAIIIDVNGDDTYKEGHIPGAINYVGQKGALASLLPKDKSALIVAYCGGPMCTAWEKAAVDVKKLGYTNVKHFKAGIKGWKDAGENVEKGG